MQTCPEFTTLAEFKEYLQKPLVIDERAQAIAKMRNAELTKPLGSLGRLEELALWYIKWRGLSATTINKPQIVVFAGNHGVAARGVSAFPTYITKAMVNNFNTGGAAINQLAKLAHAQFHICPIELDTPTRDFTCAPALDARECLSALRVGWQAVDANADLLVLGEMGIGNTTVASAMAAALYREQAHVWVGRGTGISDTTLHKKITIVAKALDYHAQSISCPLSIVCCLGGREFAAIIGAIAHARLLRIPVILDGFATTVAAAVIDHIATNALDHTIAGHLSAEAGHARLLKKLYKEPLLHLELRLGEASGAALAIYVLRAALACHFGMARMQDLDANNV